MMLGLLERRSTETNDQLLKLYWNRAGVKRELRDLRRERYELLDKLKEHEGSIARAKEQLEGLERLLTNPLAAANAMVYFQLRHLWDTSARRLALFADELEAQRERRERKHLHEAALAKRKRRLDAVDAKLDELGEKRGLIVDEIGRLEQRLKRLNVVVRLLRGPRIKRRLAGLANGRSVLDERIDELKDLNDKIRGENLPELEGLSLDSRRLLNTAVVAFAQHLVVHFMEHDLALLAQRATERPVGDMKFGDRGDCDRMVERIRERIKELKQQQNIAEPVRKRTELLVPLMRYRNETDAVPLAECVDSIDVVLTARQTEPARRASDAPLRINVLNEDFWDLLSVLR
jgi:septal ring factor EnvC (AmiA/AmiB activator)